MWWNGPKEPAELTEMERRNSLEDDDNSVDSVDRSPMDWRRWRRRTAEDEMIDH